MVMLVAAAVCPHPPLIVPEVAAGAAVELDGLRAACGEAIARLDAARPDLLAVVGGGPASREYPAGGVGSLRPYGVDVTVSLGDPPADAPALPLSLTVGAWLLHRVGWSGPARAYAVGSGSPVKDCVRLGAHLAGLAGRVALLVLGDGSARRDDSSPGWPHAQAVAFDDTVAQALAEADAGALERLDAALAEELMAAGRAAWQVLAGAARDAGLRGDLLAYHAPYGVAYFVAAWT